MRLENDEGLLDLGLVGSTGRAQDRVIGGDVTPTDDPETEFLGKRFEGRLLGLESSLGEENVSNGVVALSGKGGGESVGTLSDEEIVGDARHDTGTVTITGVCTG